MASDDVFNPPSAKKQRYKFYKPGERSSKFFFLHFSYMKIHVLVYDLSREDFRDVYDETTQKCLICEESIMRKLDTMKKHFDRKHKDYCRILVERNPGPNCSNCVDLFNDAPKIVSQQYGWFFVIIFKFAR